MEETELRYASAPRLLAEGFAAFLPPDRQSVADYAAQHRWLANEGGGYVGRWDHDMVPYLVEPMEELTSLDHLTVAVVGPGQSAKTSIAENWLLRSVGGDPGNMLWYMQTDQVLEAFVKDRINPLIDGHDILSKSQGLKSVDDSLHFKRFRSMAVQFLPATRSNLISKSAPRIIADEIDAYPPSLGDVKALLDIRRQTYGAESMMLAVSHPDRARGADPAGWKEGIMSLWADSDRRVWYWQCPHCGAFSSPAPTAARIMTLEYDPDGSLDEVAASAHLVCPVNGCVIEDKYRRQMNRTGRWVGDGQEIDESGLVTGELVKHSTAGFWILGVMSPFILGGIGGLARARVKAERELEVTGEEKTLREVMSKQWGIPYSPSRKVGSVDANTLAERARSETTIHLGVVPLDVRFLTVGTDCQAAYFEWLVRGWGINGESWVIATGRLPANPATSPEDWDKLYEEVLSRAWPLADGSGRQMLPRGGAFDLNGPPGTSAQAYSAWRRWRAHKGSRVRKYGSLAGRDLWSILPTQGAEGLNAPRLAVAYPDTRRKASKFARGEVPVARFNPNQFKDDLSGQLLVAEAGPLYIHCPAALRSKQEPHIWFEQLVAETRDLRGRWEKAHNGVRNEVLDLMVMTHVVAHLHGLSRINWDKPPAWAAAWDTNTMIMAAPAGAAIILSGGSANVSPVVAANGVRPESLAAAKRKSLISRLA
ncbi:terminase gpA endonuclease subunit [Telmatospirillum sp.]|uniref:terminase gpA endonuclease subunit n=1 Tax=Telmatospirillum sp. TaxID=2079197 RepID=UPI0028518956|nr:terminase gpA endonuclease subunit [Telmatospirillum sp.]MDR3438962.1 phage terminase large subunit family protein [Telmatospirillum sp.]